MAHQDYVSRSNSSKKKKSPYKKQAPQKSQSLPLKVKVMGFVTIFIVGGFSYFLWTIKNTEPEAVIPLVVSKPTSQPSTVLPTPPKEKWAYRKELTEKEVEVGEYEIEKKGPYKMQCGSFKSRQQAEKLKANIAFSGLSSQIGESKGSNGTYYKVFLGPYTKKREAEKDKHKLRNNNINYCEIWGWK